MQIMPETFIKTHENIVAQKMSMREAIMHTLEGSMEPIPLKEDEFLDEEDSESSDSQNVKLATKD